MVKLNKKQKAKFVALDYYIGRLVAMEFVEGMFDFKNDTQLQQLFNTLYNYKNFGDGDDFENNTWNKILKYLELNDIYEELWNEEEELEKGVKNEKVCRVRNK